MFQYAFEKLDVWQKSIELCVSIYRLTGSFPNDEKFGLISQIRRCAASVSANLAEGSVRFSNKDKIRFYEISYGSLMELLNYLILIKKLELIDEPAYQELRSKIDEIANKSNALVRSQR
jgi:four helix bundle protein